MTLRPPRRRAEVFARAVEAGVTSSGRSLDSSLALVGRLRAIEPVDIEQTFRAELRVQLVAAAWAQFEPVRAPAHEQAPAVRQARAGNASVRRRAAAASGLLALGAGTGVAVASQQALPGDVLYPVKRAMEGVELRFAGGNTSEGGELLSQATTRLDEVRELIARDPADPEAGALVTAALADFDSDALDGSRLLLSVYRTTGDETAVATVHAFAGASAATLAELTAVVPADASDELRAAADLVSSLDRRARQLCATCASVLAPVELPGEPTALAYASVRELLDRVERVGAGGPGTGGSHTGGQGGHGPGHPQLPSAGVTPSQQPEPPAGSGHGGPSPSPGGIPPTPSSTGLPTGPLPTPPPVTSVPVPTVPVPTVPLPTVTVPKPTVPHPTVPVPTLPTLPTLSLLPGATTDVEPIERP